MELTARCLKHAKTWHALLLVLKMSTTSTSPRHPSSQATPHPERSLIFRFVYMVTFTPVAWIQRHIWRSTPPLDYHHCAAACLHWTLRRKVELGNRLREQTIWPFFVGLQKNATVSCAGRDTWTGNEYFTNSEFTHFRCSANSNSNCGSPGKQPILTKNIVFLEIQGYTVQYNMDSTDFKSLRLHCMQVNFNSKRLILQAVKSIRPRKPRVSIQELLVPVFY